MGWGGKRKGAGRKSKAKKPAVATDLKNMLPLDYLLSVMRDETADPDRRMKAAKCAAQYCHKKGDRSQKDGKQRAAEKAGAGKFAAGAPPLRLIKNLDD